MKRPFPGGIRFGPAPRPRRRAPLGHLDEAIRLGWTDRAHLEADTDLVRLRADPRWAERLDRLRR